MKLDGATFQSEIEIAKRNSPRAVCVCVCIIAVIFRVPSRGIAIFFQTLPTGMEKGGGNGGEKHTLYGRQVKLFEKVSVSVRSF